VLQKFIKGEISAKEINKLSPEERKRIKEGAIRYVKDVDSAKKEDSPDSFAAFFELMEGVPLQKFALNAVREAYRAHKEGKGSLHEWFRECGKTTVFTKNFLLYRIAKEPHKTNMLIRINDEKANETAKAIADVIEYNPIWEEHFGHIRPDLKRGWSANGYFVKDTSMTEKEWKLLRNRSPDYPTIVGYGWKSGSIVGSRINGVLIIDDIHDSENTESERELARIKRVYFENIAKCVMRGAWELWNFTPWQHNDIYSDVRPNQRRFILNKVPVMRPAKEGEPGAQYWEVDKDIPYSGKWWYLAWPDNFDFERIAQIYLTRPETAGEYVMFAFERQYLLDLKAMEGFTLKAEWLHQFPADEINTSWPVFFGIDYASNPDRLKHRERDYFAMAIMRAIPGGGLVLVDGVRRHLTKPEALDLVMSFWVQYPTLQRISVETIGTGEEFYNDLIMLQDLQERTPPLYSVKHGRKSKGERFVDWLAPRFQKTRIWITDSPSPFIREFRNEWLGWDKAPHDDCLDATYIAAWGAQHYMPSKAERTFRRKRKRSPYASLAG